MPSSKSTTVIAPEPSSTVKNIVQLDEETELTVPLTETELPIQVSSILPISTLSGWIKDCETCITPRPMTARTIQALMISDSVMLLFKALSRRFPGSYCLFRPAATRKALSQRPQTLQTLRLRNPPMPDGSSFCRLSTDF